MSKFTKVIGVLMVLLVINLPISFAQEVRGSVDEDNTEQENRNIGEDILINVDEYQPNIIKSGLLSKQNVNVFALLRGVPINPSIKIARIKSINAVPINITTKPDGSKVNIGGITFRAPKREELSYDNMGYLVVPVRKMKEEEMPDEINIAVNARIYFDISEALLYSEYQDALLEQKEEDWLKESNQHQFFGGYVRADEVKSDKASFVFYDTDKNKVSSFSLKPGEIKRVNSYSRLTRTLVGSGYTGLFDNFRIKLDSINSIGSKAKILIFKDNQFSTVVLSEGTSLYDGSEWYVDKINEKQDGFEVVLKKKGVNILGGSKTLSFRARDCSRYNGKEKECKDNSCDYFTSNILDALIDKLPFIKMGDCVERSVCSIVSAKNCKKAPYNERCKLVNSNCVDKDYDELFAKDNLIQTNFKNTVKNYVDSRSNPESYPNIIEKFDDFLKNNPSYLSDAIGYLKEIQKYYLSELKKITLEENELSIKKQELEYELSKATKEEDKNKIQSKIDDINSKLNDLNAKKAEIEKPIDDLSRIMQIETPVIKEEKDLNDYYRNAISAYERVISDYGDETEEIKNLKIQANQKIANLHFKLQDYSTAIADYSQLANEDIINRGFYLDRINIINRFLDLEETKVEPIQDNGKQVTLQLIDVTGISEESKPKAYLKVAGGEAGKYELGQNVVGDWYVSIIEQSKIILTNKNKDIKDITFTLNEERLVDSIKVQLTNIDLKLEAHITIEPQIEEAMSEANFNLHLNIEKKPKLEKFVGNLDNAINKTEKLIEKLDKIISNTEKIQNYWTKFCYITFGTLWVKNLVTGFFGSTGVARKKISEKWHNKYETSKEISEGKSYDQFLINNRGDYEKDLNNAGEIIKDIQSKKYLNDPDVKKFTGLNDEEKADFYWQKEMFHKEPQNNWQEYINIQLSSKERDVYGKVQKLTFDNFEKYPMRGEVEKYTGEINKNNFEQNREKISTVYKWEELNKGRNDVFDEFKETDWYKSNSDSSNSYITTLNNQYNQKSTVSQADINYISLDQKIEDRNYLDPSTGDKKGISSIEDNKPEIGKTVTFDDGSKAKIAEKAERELRPQKIYTLYKEGRNKGKIQYISINAEEYAEIRYASSGLIESADVYKRGIPFDDLGTSNSVRQSSLEEIIKNLESRKELSVQERSLLNDLRSLKNTVQNCNRKSEFKSWSAGDKVAGCDNYVVSEKAAVVTGSQCTDFMNPTDCGLLFNACDPVICPASRCNLGGRWTVDNVVETGIVGSIALCAPNFGVPPAGVAVPICITGILAGLKNIQSILKGFAECLKSQKVKGESVGICDRIRSVYVCEMLWREGIAIFNVNGGLLGVLSDKIAGKVGGGAEYSNFKQSLQDSAGSVGYFTQSYAKNVFAAYSGKSLGEIGSEICKSAIYGNVPGIGDFFEQALRPESPPQFFAFFDEVPYQDVLEKKESIYTVFYHIYAGENEDIIYNVYMQNVDEEGNVIQPFGRVYLTTNSRLEKGQFADQNLEKVFFSGYNQICVETKTNLRGVRTECGFGKVTTDYGINYLNDAYTAYDASKKINTKEECVSETGRITNLEYGGGSASGFNLAMIPEAAVGTVSTGLLNTGVVRTCSAYDPDVGTGKDEWVPVGSCGNDDKERDLGQCWLYKPNLNELIKDTARRSAVTDNLKDKATESLGKIAGYENCDISRLNGLAEQNKNSQPLIAIDYYQKIIECSSDEWTNVNAQFKIGEAYEMVAELVKSGEIVQPVSPVPPSNSQGTIQQQVINQEPPFESPVTVDATGTAKIEEAKDTTAPTTTRNIEGTKGNDDWYSSDVTISLTCQDNLIGSGCDKTWYSIVGTNELGKQYLNPITLSNEGKTTLTYNSVDKGGYGEDAKELIIKIDKTRPWIRIDKISSNVGSILVESVVGDNFLLNAKCDFRVTGSINWIPLSDTKLDTSTQIQTDGYYKDTCLVSGVGSGSYDIKISVTDQAGWIEEKIIEKVSLL